MIARGDMMSVDDVTEILAVNLLGTILDDEQIVIAANQGEPFPVRNRRQKKSTVISAGAFLVRKFRLWNCSKRKAC